MRVGGRGRQSEYERGEGVAGRGARSSPLRVPRVVALLGTYASSSPPPLSWLWSPLPSPSSRPPAPIGPDGAGTAEHDRGISGWRGGGVRVEGRGPSRATRHSTPTISPAAQAVAIGNRVRAQGCLADSVPVSAPRVPASCCPSCAPWATACSCPPEPRLSNDCGRQSPGNTALRRSRAAPWRSARRSRLPARRQRGCRRSP